MSYFKNIMKFLFDFFPIALFFIFYKLFGIYIATGAAIVAAIIQVIYCYFRRKKIEFSQWLTLAIIVLMGGATLLFHNEVFIKWKPSIIEWVFAGVFLFSQWFAEKPLTQRLLENNLQLPSHLWLRLNLSWVMFFLGMGLLNLYVIYHFDTNTWVNFKLFGMLGLTILFVLWQAFYIGKYIKE